MRICKYLLALSFLLFSGDIIAQLEIPTISPTATYTNTEGEEEESTSYSGSAPIKGVFRANPSNIGPYNPYYEWRFYKEGEEEEPYLIRYEENTEYTFTVAGAHRIVCYASFINGIDTISYTKEYWDDIGPFTVSISESKLEMPNAFSPNGDGINDIYKAKEGYKSLIEFHAYIFNRWGQKLYEWDDPSGGWDGKFNGHDVKQGVYYCLVKAKGADGRKFNIRKDVNLLRGYTEKSGATGGDQ